MATSGGSKAKAKTRHQSGSKLSEFVGRGTEFIECDVPTLRAVMRKGILIKEKLMIEEEVQKNDIKRGDVIREVVPLILGQWQKLNAKFCSPVIITEKSIVSKVERLWDRVEKVAWGHCSKEERDKVDGMLDCLFDITTCKHEIMLCQHPESGCSKQTECKVNAHIQCSCPLPKKIPVMELRWLYGQRNKRGEYSDMMMTTNDNKETDRQNKAAKRAADEVEADLKRCKKMEEEQNMRLEQEEQAMAFMQQESDGDDIEQEEVFKPPAHEVKRDQDEVNKLVDHLLEQRLGKDNINLVVRYLGRPGPRRNTMSVTNTAMASVRYGVSLTATAAIASEFLKDLIAAGHLPKEKAYLVCDKSKLSRSKKAVMDESRVKDKEKRIGEKLVGIGYDGRKDKHTRAMVPDSRGVLRMRMIKEEHVSVSEEPSGRYLTHFLPEDPIHPEKPAQKVAQHLYDIVKEEDSVDSLQVLKGDSTNANTGWKDGTHAILEKLLGRKLYWAICMLHTNELPLRHLIAIIDGPTSSDTGFTGEVCKLLSKVQDMEYDPGFKAMPKGEELIHIPDNILKSMSTDQKQCYKLVLAVKSGQLPEEQREMLCGPINHARWLTTAQRILFLWTRKHGLTSKPLKVLELLVKFCLEYYFKMYFDIKVKNSIVDAPYHILTQLKILKTLPKKVRDAVTFYIRTGAWYSHSECLLLSLLASSDGKDRQFAVTQILKLRGGQEFGDNSVRPRITPKLNLSATSLTTLITWKPGQVEEPVFTCSKSSQEIQGYLQTPYKAPEFSCHTQSTEACVKLVTEAAAAVAGQEARDGFIRARLHNREAMPLFTTKKHMLATF